LAKVFLWLPPLIVAQAFFAAPIIPLADNAVMALLAGQREQYGKLRLWGAVGWGLSAPLVGAMIERSGLVWIFWIYAAILLLALFAGRRLPMDLRSRGASFRRGMRDLLANRRWLLFLALVFVGGLCMNVVNTFLFLYMGQLGASAGLMGLSLSISTLSELPIFFFSDRLIARWGARGLLLIAMGAYALRLLALSLANAAWMILPLQLLHGLTFSAMWTAGVSYSNQIAPPGLGATAQGLFSGVKLGVGAAAGAFAGGLLYQAIGLSATFLWTGLLALFCLLAYLGIEHRLGESGNIAAPLDL
jgi:PPP family 3-phenylpropionic acid transporter